MNADYAKNVEKVLTSDANSKVKQATFMRFYMTLVHETGHEISYPDAATKYGEQDDRCKYPSTLNEAGRQVEQKVWGTDGYKPLDNQGDDKYDPGVVEKVIDNANKTDEGRKTLPTVPTTP